MKKYTSYQGISKLQEKSSKLASSIEDFVSRVQTNGHVDKVVDFDLLYKTIDHLNNVSKLPLNP